MARVSGPIMEKDGLFSYQMYDCLEKGNIKKIPIIIGFNSEEWIEDDSKLIISFYFTLKKYKV